MVGDVEGGWGGFDRSVLTNTHARTHGEDRLLIKKRGCGTRTRATGRDNFVVFGLFQDAVNSPNINPYTLNIYQPEAPSQGALVGPYVCDEMYHVWLGRGVYKNQLIRNIFAIEI